MRVAPRPVITAGLAVGYMLIVVAAWLVLGVDYDEIGSSTGSIVEGIVLPVALASAFLAIATSYLGWWGPSLRETLGAPRWLWAVPVLMVLPGLGSLLGGAGTADRSGGYLAALALGTLLVGFGEEMLTRGVGLVGLRGRFREPLAWFLSCLLFGLIHAVNLAFGQSLGSTVQQIALAFLAGSVFYVTRRVSGTLVLCMLLHAWIDFTTFAFADAAAAAESPATILGLAQFAAFVLALAGVYAVLRRGADSTTQPSPAVA